MDNHFSGDDVCVNLVSTASGLCNDGVSTHTPVLQTLLGAAVIKD
jgi:hypothetical protein